MRTQGKVKFFSDSRGYGFITPAGTKGDSHENVFCHFSEIEMEGFKTLAEGQLVEFEIEQTIKGQKAVRVRPIENPYSSAA